jgi:hypothetical protein
MLTRRVRRLHVRAAAEDDARHAATLLSDALRTASLAGADERRFVVIRRLPLGRISTRASAASLALQIERVAAEVMADAVVFNLPAALTANAVMFADRADAVVALATLHAQGLPTADWFWPQVVPGWGEDAPRGARWTMLVEAAHGPPDAAVVAAAVVDRAIAAGVEHELVASIAHHQAIHWLRLEGWTRLAPVTAGSSWRWPSGARGEVLRRWSKTWRAADARLVWLATLLSVAEQRACAGDPRLPARIAFELQSLEALSHAPRREPEAIDGEAVQPRADPPDQRQAAPSSTPPGVPHADPLGFPHADPPDADDAPDPARSAETRRQPIGRRARIANAPAAASLPQPEAPQVPSDAVEDVVPSHAAVHPGSTAFGGLLFLIPVLQRLGFSAFLAENPSLLESALPARLLCAVGQRVGMPLDDPLALALGAEAEDDAEISASIAAWRVAVRRWCRRNARIGLATLIRRRGTVHVSRTHIDTHFPLAELDVRVRRWALDVDPGWVPWLGRVVTFSYGDEHDR